MSNELNAIFAQFEATGNEIPVQQVQSDLDGYTIFLYGAGSAGIAFLCYLRKIGIAPSYFIDGSPAKWGTNCEGLPVFPLEEAAKRTTVKSLVIVTINTDGKRYCKSFDEALRQPGHGGVHRAIQSAGFERIIDYTYFRRCYGLFRGDKYNLPSCSDVYLMQENRQRILDAYALLSDESSREVFRKIVQFRMLDDGVIVPTLSQENQYFERSLYLPIENENFLDCGAYNGITLQAFLAHNPRFASYYALEPDPVNFCKLKEYAASLPAETADKIVLVNQGSFDAAGTRKLCSLGGPGSFLSERGHTAVELVALDSLLEGKPCSFIKMNIEGAELPSLRGASQLIRDQSPSMAIAGYHKTWDLWEIPLFVSRLNRGYQLYLRSYMNHISFMYYFISDDRCVLES